MALKTAAEVGVQEQEGLKHVVVMMRGGGEDWEFGIIRFKQI